MNQRRTLACLLALFPLVPAFAQDAKPSPRELYERAAFAEEHEHDLATAERVYTQALEAAEAAGDKATADAAAAARERVLVLQGKAAPAKATDALSPQARRLLAEGADMPDDDERLSSVVRDLSLFGAACVPPLERMLLPIAPDANGLWGNKIAVGGSYATINPKFAARVLAAIDAPEAVVALGRGMDSADLIVRKAIVGRLELARHRELLERAATDPVPAIRDIALGTLAACHDLSLAPLYEPLVSKGHATAINWFAREDPGRLLAWATDESFPVEPRQRIARQMQNYVRTSTDPAVLGQALRLQSIIADSGDPAQTLIMAIFECARQIAERGSPHDAETAEQILLARLDAAHEPWLLNALTHVFSPATIAWMQRNAGTLLEGDSEWLDRLDNLVRARQDDPTLNHGMFEAWHDLLLALPPVTSLDVKVDRRAMILFNVVARLQRVVKVDDVPPVRLMQGYDAFTEQQRRVYQWVLDSWLATRTAPKRGEVAGPLERDALPVCHAVLAHSPADNQIRAVIAALGAIGDPSQIGLLAELYLDGNGSAEGPGRDLAALDVEGASRALLQRLEPSLALQQLDATDRQRWEHAQGLFTWLPDQSRLALWKQAWSRARAEDAKPALLFTLISSIQGAEATAELARVYPSIAQTDQRSRVGAIRRFGSELYEPALGILEAALSDRSVDIRSAARTASDAFRQQRVALEEFRAWMAASADQRTATSELIALLSDPNRDVVLGAVKALGVVKARVALPQLVKLLARDDPALKAAVQAAIDNIGA